MHCKKKCKNQGGLKLHMKIHSNDDINSFKIFEMKYIEESIKKACKKILTEELHSEEVLKEINEYLENFSEFKELSDLQKKLITLTLNDKELFYSRYYVEIVSKSERYLKFKGNTSKVVLMKLADIIQADIVKEQGHIDNEIHTKNLSEREVAALQYLGGYVISNLSKKIKNCKHYKSDECQQALALLTACKTSNDVDRSLKLVSALNRGWLCIINETIEKIFVIAEKYFHISTLKFGLRHIDINDIVEKLRSFSYIKDYFSEIKHLSEIPVSEEVSYTTLHNILHLYIKVRSFTFAKDKVEKHKIKNKQNKSKALRKEIKQKSSAHSSKQVDMDG